MVKEKTVKSKKTYICEECNFAYFDKVKAKECESWCSKHKSCNISITKYAINKNLRKWIMKNAVSAVLI